jgi:hypothetical protein
MKNYTEIDFKITDFIMGWEYDHKIIDQLVEYFMKNKHLWSDGRTLAGLNKEWKDSQDCTIQTRFDLPFYNYFECLQKSFDQYMEKYNGNVLLKKKEIKVIEGINFQYYKPGAGYKKWHCERTSLSSAQRVLVFMTYLNNVPNGGTDFLYQNLRIPAKKGLTIIWPSEFTHVHKGQITNEHEKMIFTGWFSYTNNDK